MFKAYLEGTLDNACCQRWDYLGVSRFVFGYLRRVLRGRAIGGDRGWFGSGMNVKAVIMTCSALIYWKSLIFIEFHEIVTDGPFIEM